MQKYAQELSQSDTLDRDTIHLLFPNLNNLLNFQRIFSTRLEETADIPWREQRWGHLFTDNVGKLISLLSATLMVILPLAFGNVLDLCPGLFLIRFTAFETKGGRVRGL